MFRPTPIHLRSLRLTTLSHSAIYRSAARGFATSACRLNVLKSPAINEQATQGVEGLHRDDTAPIVPINPTTTQNDLQGDWVLFHPVYSPEELKSVKVVHRETESFSDSFASFLVRLMRSSFDIVSRYKHKEIPKDSQMTVEELRKGGYIMDSKAWLNRILFLETVAGVPGMVAATTRHLRSLRLMRRDSGWIRTLLEEAENERMHLMTFMTLKKPSILFRAMVLCTQGVFYNLFFLSYLLSPRTCHRFVGYLEEEAVITYTRCIEEIESGRLPEWENMEAPEIAKDYWRLPSNAKLLDVIYAVRSDESTHRFVNHSLASLQKTDVNPFAIREPNMFVKGVHPGFDRSESAKYVEESQFMGRKEHGT